MTENPVPANTTDFNPTQIATSVNKHDEEIILIRSRLDEVEQKLSSPEKLALVIEAAQGDSKKMDKLFSKLFCDLMEKDPEVEKCIESHIKRSDRNAVWKIVKQFGSIAGGVILLLIGAILYALAAKYIK